MIFRLFLAIVLTCSICFSEDTSDKAINKSVEDYNLVKCLLLALEKNPTIVKLKLDKKVAEWQKRSSSSGFEWVLNSTTSFADTDDVKSETLSLSKEFVTGTEVGLSTTAKDYKGSTESNSSSLSLNISQELLAGSTYRENHLPIYRAGIRDEQAGNRLEDQIRSTLYKVSTNYFQYIKSEETIKVNFNALKQSKKFLETVKELKKAGKGTSLDVATAEVQVASREEAVLKSETVISNALDSLKRSIGIEMDEQVNISKDISLEVILPKLSYDEACKHALESRPDVLNSRLSLVLQNREMQVKNRSKKPSLKLSYSATFSETDNDLFDSYRYEEEPEHMLSLQFSTPILRKKKIAEYMEAKIGVEKSEIEFWELTQSIKQDIKRVIREIEASSKTIEVQKQRLLTEEIRVKSYETKFENGLIDSLEVTRAYDDLDKARIDLINSKLSLKILVAEFHVVVGSAPVLVIDNEKILLEKPVDKK